MNTNTFIKMKKNIVDWLIIKKWIVGMYCFILIASALLLFFLPTKNLQSSETTNQLSCYNNYELLSKLSKLNFLDYLDNTDLTSTNGSWQFQYTGELINLEFSGTYNVFVQYKDTNDGTVDVTNHIAHSYLNSVDVSAFIKPPTVELSGESLVLNCAPAYQMNLAEYSYDFTLKQFIGENVFDGEYDYTFIGGNVLLIRIPRGIKLYYKNLNLAYIN